jgi:hypothetical protein
MFEWIRRILRRANLVGAHAQTVDHQVFEAAVASAFRYLADDYGYTRRPLQVIAYERWVEFDRSDAKVRVQQEMGSGPWVTLTAPNSIARGLRREFGLHELEQEMARAGKYVRASASPANIQESLDVLASTLKQVGTEVLNGDFSVLFARLQRHVDAVGKST